MGVGQGVNTTFWSTAGRQPNNTENEPFLQWLYDVGNATDAPTVFSVSYGDNEDTVDFDYAVRVNAEFVKAGARGISLLSASGDGGVAGSQTSPCPGGKFIPTFPAASPYITAVGGTTGSNEVAAEFSSGGFSNYWARPDYQETVVANYLKNAPGLPAATHFNQTSAGFPDVAAQAEDFIIVIHGLKTPVDGTSCASPTFAGIVALLNDLRLSKGKTTLGYLNPLLYQNPDAFNDITSGHNPGCATEGFPAYTGWDPVTGLGTPDFQKLSAVVLALP